MAAEYELAYGEPIPVIQLVTKLAGIMQEYTQSGCVCAIYILSVICLICYSYVLF